MKNKKGFTLIEIITVVVILGIIAIIAIAAILFFAGRYLYKEKKKGNACIGCPYSDQCPKHKQNSCCG